MAGALRNRDYVLQEYWQGVGSLFDIHLVLAAGELGDATVAALAANGLGQCVVYSVPNGTVSAEFRFYGTGFSANETVTLEVYAAAGVDYYRRVAQLTLTIGAGQKGAASSLFVDTIAEAVGEVWLSVAALVSPADDTIASWGLNVHGYDRFAFLASATTGDLDPAVAGTADDALYIESRIF